MERATYTWNVKSTGGYRAHLQGRLTDESLINDTLTRSFTLEHPITTQQAACRFPNYVDSNYVHTGEYGDIPVRLTAKPEDINLMTNKFSELATPSTPANTGTDLMPGNASAISLQRTAPLEIFTNIAYPRYMIEEPLQSNGDLIAHELGHQWWGIS